ncbi:MAG: GH116 family glycosyl-hydrolase, partial [Armatimonadota bacterium]
MSSQDNDCSQPNCCSGISRRQFLHGALGVAATAAGWSIFGSSSPLEASPDHKLTDDEIKQWFAALKGAGRPLKYSSRTSPLAAVPMGGIGCGNVYIGSDGALKDWLIFNNVQPMQIPNTFFAVCTGKDQVTVLQTSKVDGVDDKHLVSDISLIGEYPYAKLAYKDSKLPVDITLEAVSPMIPLDSSASAYPAAIFTFKIKNPGTAAKDVTLMFAAQNSAALGNLGGNTNTALMVDGLTGLSMAVEPGTAARIESDLRIVSTARALKLTSSEKTPRLEYISTPSSSLRKEDIPANKSLQTVFWLDNPGNLDGDAAVALLNAVKAGSILVISNASALLNHYDAAKRQTADKAARPNILIDDFETGDYGNWTVQGEAFGKAPQTGTLPSQNSV